MKNENSINWKLVLNEIFNFSNFSHQKSDFLLPSHTDVSWNNAKYTKVSSLKSGSRKLQT